MATVTITIIDVDGFLENNEQSITTEVVCVPPMADGVVHDDAPASVKAALIMMEALNQIVGHEWEESCFFDVDSEIEH